MWTPERHFAAMNALAIERAQIEARHRKQDGREVIVQQILRESLHATLDAFPDIAMRLDGDAARRRIASAWADVLLAEAGR